MSGRTLRAALVGCGRMGAHTANALYKQLPAGYLPINHADAMCATNRIELLACCDTDRARVKQTATKYTCTPYLDYREMIQAVRPEVLAIATRTDGRCEIIEFAAKNGVKAMHVEKPLSRNMIDCKRALQAVHKAQVHLTYGTTRRFMDIYRKARALVVEGTIGTLQEIVIAFGHSPLLWYHPHSVDLLLFLAGSNQIRHVQATCQINPQDVEPLLVNADPIIDHALVQFENDVRGIITGVAGFDTILSGSAGRITIAANGGWLELKTQQNDSDIYHLTQERIAVQSTLGGTVRAFTELCDAIETGMPVSIAPDEIAQAQRILFGFVHSSLQEGRRVKLSEVPDGLTVTGKSGLFYA